MKTRVCGLSQRRGLSKALLAIFLTAIPSAVVFPQSTMSDSVQHIIQSIVTEMEQGVSTGNKHVWQQHMADDGILINRDGKLYTKQDIIDDINPQTKGRVLEIIPTNMRFYLRESSALVSFVADEKLRIFGQTMDTQYPSVMYFEKRNGQWQMVFFTYFEQPVNPKRVSVGKNYLQSFTGIYALSDDSQIEISAADSNLAYRKVGSTGSRTILYPIDTNGRFFREGTESEFIFDRDEGGRQRLRQRRNWIDLIWYKL